jgi:hypothetical protein
MPFIHLGTHSATRAAAVATTVEFPQCVGLLCDADITATVTFANGTAVSIPLQKGYNPIQATKAVFASGTIIALYN